MPRSARRASPRAGYRDRHGRGIRSAVTGPHLPMLRTRADFFDSCVASAVEYLRTLWPQELAAVHFEVASFPRGTAGPEGVDRWQVDPRARRVTLYRVPIERLVHLHRDDDWHRRSYIESCVFRAVAELLGKDPWDIAPERYRHF
ncbi:metallopeptidase family protein [Protaetiibacter larvae]|uniref:Metallopeptidase family protein n=1 Tax=Protaetiibacter larvae TaxID=2592654 RepID=A0A5C1Y6W6_9MICO|nr:metallopeptidase family protein [Protaetiibacter larvae]QEO08607.1 metallopeptidase family protein [Protaetiibacter larvae]